jgi:methionyl-tRNA formyltransferase
LTIFRFHSDQSCLSTFGGATRVVFMGSPRFAIPSVHALLRHGHEIVLVVTQPARPAGRGKTLHQPPVAALAERLGLALAQPERIRAPAAIDQLAARTPDAIVVAAYGQILPRSVLDIPRLGCINVHPSLLPRHRGAAPIPAAILAGDAETGVAIMQMDEGMDTGPVLSMRRIPLRPEDDQLTLTSKLAVLGAELLAETLAAVAAGRSQPVRQEAEMATVSRPIARGDATLAWERPAVELWRQVRAYAEAPQAITWWGKRALRIIAADYVADDGRAALEPGEVIAWGPEARAPQAIAVGTGRGVLIPRILGVEGRRLMPVDAFLPHRRSPHERSRR